jgi:hypothetical protein
MPNISRSGLKSLGHTRGKGLKKNIEAIFTLTEKKNCFGYEILEIENRESETKKKTIFSTKLLNR